jgi:hypothetical protein
MAAGVGGLRAAGVVALCALPSAALNVWPKVPHLAAGTASGSDVAFVVIVVTAVLLMAAVPFAAKKASSFGWKALFWAFGFSLAVLNYSLAVASVGKMRESDAGPLRELVHKAAGVDSRIERVRNSRSLLPPVPPAVDAAMLAAADQAVRLADEARRQECRKVGDNCRKRVEELAAATTKRAPLLAQKAVADQIHALEAELRDLERQRQDLGPVPKDVDAQAVRLSKQLGRFIDLGENPVEATADIIIAAMSAFAELIGLLGPVVFLTAMEGEARPSRAPWATWRRRHHVEPDVSTKPGNDATSASPAAESAGVAPSAATPAPAKKRRKNNGAGVREFGPVREWRDSRTVARPDGRAKPGDAYAAYRGWCAENGQKPVSLTAFGLTMKGELGIVYEERNKRGFYVGIALVSEPKLVAAA